MEGTPSTVAEMHGNRGFEVSNLGSPHWKRAYAKRLYPYILLVLDVGITFLLYGFTLAINADATAFAGVSGKVLAVLCIAHVASLALIGGYSYRVDKRKFRFISEHLLVSVALAVVAFNVIFSVVTFGQTTNTPRGVVFGVLVAFPLISIAYRVFLGRVQATFQVGNGLCFIGCDERTIDLFQRLRNGGWGMKMFAMDPHGYRVGERLDPLDPTSPMVEEMSVEKLGSSINGRYIEGYILAERLEDLPEDLGYAVTAAHLKGSRMYTYETFFTQELQMIPPSELSLDWFLGHGFRLHRSVSYDRIKRLFDIVLAVSGLILAAPIMLLVVLFQMVAGRGPIFFAQDRVGVGGRVFSLYKFRTMRVGAHEEGQYTQKNDSRVTKLGHFLRKTRIDELPQLWNVIKGDMSVIGPRAEWVDLVRDYEQKFPFYDYRHTVKPGITGWAQVNYRYGQSDRDALEKLYYDLYYVRHYSLMLDVTITIKTAFTVFFGKGQ